VGDCNGAMVARLTDGYELLCTAKAELDFSERHHGQIGLVKK